MSLNASHMSCVYIRGKRVDIVQLAPKNVDVLHIILDVVDGGRGTHAGSNRISNTFERCALHASFTHMCDLSKRSRKPAVASP